MRRWTHKEKFALGAATQAYKRDNYRILNQKPNGRHANGQPKHPSADDLIEKVGISFAQDPIRWCRAAQQVINSGS